MSDEQKQEEKAGKVKLVKMVREASEGPTKADVHPDEVENYAAAGWQKA